MIYMLKNSVFVLLLSVVLFTGCGYKQTNTQIRDIAYLKFNKSSFKNYTVIVNDKYKFKLDGCSKRDINGECRDDTSDKLYEISSGGVTIEVYDDKNNLIMRKEFYIGSSNTMEVDLQ